MQAPTFTKLMAEATDLVQQGRLAQATTVIQQALFPVASDDGPVAAPSMPVRTGGDAAVLDGYIFEVARKAGDVPAGAAADDAAVVEPLSRAGRFIDGRHEAAGAHGRYKLYVPGHAAGTKLPLIVLLHGCTQDPDDFAVGTAMNGRAEEQSFYVLYPEQSSAANPSRCWNWFRREDQQRGSGEPAAIARMTEAIVATHDVDPSRVYIAGLSAGGAMAAIVASEYPELFAAVGIHSGLPIGAASNVPDALTAMRSGRGKHRSSASSQQRFVPTIVIHGDQDRTVHPDNGQRIVDDVLEAYGGQRPPTRTQTTGRSPAGRSFTRTDYASAAGPTVVEQWVVHGAGHAWSGGDARGSHADADGPSASDAMLRFFERHAHPGAQAGKTAG